MVYPSHSTDKSKSQSHDILNETQNETEHNPAYKKLLESFQALAQVSDPVRFPLEFERRQKASGLRLTTFREAYKAWTSQQTGGGA